MAPGRVIGLGAALPWRIPEELKFFKMMTVEQTIVMGSSTLESIGRILPNREHVILSSKPPEYFDIYGDCFVMNDFDEAIKLAKTRTENVYICGGASVYKQALEKDIADEMIISFINKKSDGDVFFPEYEQYGWKEYEILYETNTFTAKRFRK